MHIRPLCVALFVVTAAILTAGTPRADDDKPTADERTRIEAALRGLGFESWGEIEREDDGRAWEIDDAHGADGKEFDIKLAADDLHEIEREEDDD
jgi:Peptidase propeptide and YPEB domain